MSVESAQESKALRVELGWGLALHIIPTPPSWIIFLLQHTPSCFTPHLWEDYRVDAEASSCSSQFTT